MGWQAPLVDIVAALARRRWLIIGIVVFGLAAGLYKLKKTSYFYRAAVVALLLPREKPQLDVSVSTGSLETGHDNAKRETTGSLMLPPSTDLYHAILTSRAVLLVMAERFGDRLDEVTEDDRSDEVVSAVRSMLKISGTDDGMITVEVTADDAVLAAEMANALVDEMEVASKAIERQLILQQSGFLGSAENEIRAELAADEKRLAAFLAEHGIVEIGVQATDILRMMRELRMQRSKIEHELIVRLESFTEDDPGVTTMRTRIEMFDEEIRQLRQNYLDAVNQENYGGIRIEYEALTERVRFKRDLLATLSTQRAVFNIRAEQPAGSVAVLKPATPAARPAGPSTKMTLGLSIIGSLVAAIAVVLLLDQWTSSTRDPYIQSRLDEIGRELIPRPLRRAARSRRRRDAKLPPTPDDSR